MKLAILRMLSLFEAALPLVMVIWTKAKKICKRKKKKGKRNDRAVKN